MKSDQVEQAVRRLMSYKGGDMIVSKYDVSGIDSSSVQLVVHIEYMINNLLTIMTNEAIFQTSGLFSPSAYVYSELETDHRSNRIVVHSACSALLDIRIKYPMSWTLSPELKDVRILNELGSASLTYDQSKPNVLGVSVEKSLSRGSAPKDKLPCLIAIVGRNPVLNVPNLVFTMNK